MNKYTFHKNAAHANQWIYVSLAITLFSLVVTWGLEMLVNQMMMHY